MLQNVRLAIVGSRSITDYDLIESKIIDILLKYNLNPISIVSGGAKGIDTIAHKFALKYNIPIQVFKPDWQLGKHAGFLRNQTIVDNCDQAVIFWDGKSKGTLDTLKKLRKSEKPYYFNIIKP
jgi:predicted Rossmann fold nucleotide-binding protein DprA/Smf involved in DNA uptake